MAECRWCKAEMLTAVDCAGNHTVKFPDGVESASKPYEEEGVGNCHDCGVSVGNYHHPGCDMERCPRCDGQLISCGCLEDEDEDED